MSGLKATTRLAKIFEVPGPTITLSQYAPTIAGALVMATLAYPEARYRDLRLRTAMRLAGRTVVDRSPGTDWFALMGESGAAIPVDEGVLYGGAKRFDSRIRKRLDAGYLSLQAFVAMERGEKPSRTWGGDWNRAAAIRDANSDGHVLDPRNFTRRYWEPSAAVIHLAAAWAGMLTAARKSGESQGDIRRVIVDGAYREELVAKALGLERLVGQGALRIAQVVLIKFRP